MPATLAADMNAIRAMFAYAPEGELISTATGFLRVPQINFFSGSEGKAGGQLTAAMIGQALGNVPAGTPYVQAAEGLYPITGAVLAQIKSFQFWADKAYSNERTKTWLRDPGRASNAVECVLALQILLPHTQALHADFAPAQVLVTEYTMATCKAAVVMDRAVKAAVTEAWVTQHPHLAAVPDTLRVVSTLQGGTRTGKKSGMPYPIANAVPRPVEPAQGEALALWWQDADCQEEYKEALEVFNDAVAAAKAQQGS